MEATLEVFSCQIVVVGNFNPAIFSPEWLAQHGLIGRDDAEEAKSNDSLLVSPTVSRLETDWCSLQVVQNQFVVLTKGPVTPSIRDLVVGIFTVIDQTPIQALGINFIGDYKMPTTESWHKVGDVLAPKTIWHKFFPEENNSVGLTELTIQVDKHNRAKIEPTNERTRLSVSYSTKIMNGICFSINNHFDVADKKISPKDSSADLAVTLISKNWDQMMVQSKELFANVLAEIAKEEK